MNRDICFLLFVLAFPMTSNGQHKNVFVPAGGNAWISGGSAILTSDGVTHWTDQSVCTLYVSVDPGELNVSLSIEAEAVSRLKVDIQSVSKEVVINPEAKDHAVGTWTITTPGYLAVTITGVSKEGASFGVLRGLMLSGSAIRESSSFVRDNEGNYFYWGRRGPSVHLRYELQGKTDIEWFYSEITVPEKNDVIGSYYMANGFADGYFGFQVNSQTERRILFSVWSPFKTDDPKSIPDEDKIILMKKGEGVYTGEFGNEGSGGQSYLRYAWKAGTTYGFLLRGQPEGDNTIYTAWFFAPEEGRWKLIASWRRPKKATYLSSLYSFLENFIPETGNIERRANFGNQWVCDKTGSWMELTQAKFTGDNTARKNYRKDYGGGISGDSFFLRNCGFFGDFTPLDQSFTLPFTGKSPVIEFKKLP